jgi:hypothetical protein
MDWDKDGEKLSWSQIRDYLCGGEGNALDDGYCPQCEARVDPTGKHGIVIGGVWWQLR